MQINRKRNETDGKKSTTLARWAVNDGKEKKSPTFQFIFQAFIFISVEESLSENRTAPSTRCIANTNLINELQNGSWSL